jgi:hypothetical protein
MLGNRSFRPAYTETQLIHRCTMILTPAKALLYIYSKEVVYLDLRLDNSLVDIDEKGELNLQETWIEVLFLILDSLILSKASM